MDETYVKVKGEWVHLYRAVDKFGKTVDFILSKRRNKAAATKVFARALEVNGLPKKIVIDKSGANTVGIIEINRMLKRFGCPVPIEMVRIKYLNNMVEQDHRCIKKRKGSDARLQVVRFCFGDARWDLGCKHDPQRTVDARTLSVCPVCGAVGLNEGRKAPIQLSEKFATKPLCLPERYSC